MMKMHYYFDEDDALLPHSVVVGSSSCWCMIEERMKMKMRSIMR